MFVCLSVCSPYNELHSKRLLLYFVKKRILYLSRGFFPPLFPSFFSSFIFNTVILNFRVPKNTKLYFFSKSTTAVLSQFCSVMLLVVLDLLTFVVVFLIYFKKYVPKRVVFIIFFSQDTTRIAI